MPRGRDVVAQRREERDDLGGDPLRFPRRPEEEGEEQGHPSAEERGGDANAGEVPVAAGRFRDEEEDEGDERRIEPVVDGPQRDGERRKGKEERAKDEGPVDERRDQGGADRAEHGSRDAIEGAADGAAQVRLQDDHHRHRHPDRAANLQGLSESSRGSHCEAHPRGMAHKLSVLSPRAIGLHHLEPVTEHG